MRRAVRTLGTAFCLVSFFVFGYAGEAKVSATTKQQESYVVKGRKHAKKKPPKPPKTNPNKVSNEAFAFACDRINPDLSSNDLSVGEVVLKNVEYIPDDELKTLGTFIIKEAGNYSVDYFLKVSVDPTSPTSSIVFFDLVVVKKGNLPKLYSFVAQPVEDLNGHLVFSSNQRIFIDNLQPGDKIFLKISPVEEIKPFYNGAKNEIFASLSLQKTNT